MRPTRISAFNKTPLARALKTADAHPNTYMKRHYTTFGENVMDIYRRTGEHVRHHAYDNRTGELITNNHSYAHGSIFMGKDQMLVFDNRAGQVIELNIDGRKDFFSQMRKYLSNIR